jgi:alpha/beta superfamily hydrolase
MQLPAEETVFLEGPTGRLEGKVRLLPAGVPARGAAVLFHPHPLYGGTFDNKVLYRLARRLAADARHPSLRINFRGAGRSEGVHDDGRGELEDARTALDAAAARFPGQPLTVIGYSFGAIVGLHAALADRRVQQLVAIGLPLAPPWDAGFLSNTGVPRHFVQGELDEFGDAPALRRFAETLTGPISIDIIPGASHLFPGQEDEAVDAVVRGLSTDRSA